MAAQAFAVEVAVETAHCREQPGQATGRLAVVMLAGDKLAQVLDLQGIPAVDTGLGTVGQDVVEVAAVSQLGVLGHLALIAQVRAEGLQLALHQRTGRRVWVKRGTTRPSTSAM
ncbi:hypothetical protein D3C72_2084910 [compost metagenome]